MSRRKNRSRSPNLPADALARARREAGLDAAGETKTDEPTQAAEPAPAVAMKAETPVAPVSDSAVSGEDRRSKRRASRRRGQPGTLRARSKDLPLDSAAVAEILANPTKTVTEDELRQQYSYVLADLRSMGLLAAALIVVLVVLAQVL